MARLVWILLGLLLAGVLALGAVVCFMGYEAVATGANPGPWWSSFLLLVVAPAIGFIFCALRVLRRP